MGQGRPIKLRRLPSVPPLMGLLYFKTGSFISPALHLQLSCGFYRALLSYYGTAHAPRNPFFAFGWFARTSSMARQPGLMLFQVACNKIADNKIDTCFSAIPLTATGCTKPWRFSVVSGAPPVLVMPRVFRRRSLTRLRAYLSRTWMGDNAMHRYFDTIGAECFIFKVPRSPPSSV